jgi:ubiquinone/menaquinone biosynthesis C-methylase UbiE
VTRRDVTGRLAGHLGLAVLLLTPAVAEARQRDAEDAQRVIDALGIVETTVAAEVGAGRGDLTTRIARQAGQGHIYTTELAANLERLRQAVAAAGVANVTVLEAAASTTNLPAGCCDAVFMRAVYHHFREPGAINDSLFAALKPGGRVAVIDFEPRSGSASVDPDRRASDGSHGVSPSAVISELEEAGFRDATETALDGRRFLVVARRPL